jgi:RNA polymerase sigma-70 factor (ECF subfamily)
MRRRTLLLAYIDRFNARDFDAIRAMLAEEVRLDLVARTTMKGKAEVQTYFHNYSGESDWLLVPGFVERRPRSWCAIRPGRPTRRSTRAAPVGGECPRVRARLPVRALRDRGL